MTKNKHLKRPNQFNQWFTPRREGRGRWLYLWPEKLVSGPIHINFNSLFRFFCTFESGLLKSRSGSVFQIVHTACPRSLDPFYTVTYYLDWVKTSWTYSIIRPWNRNQVILIINLNIMKNSIRTFFHSLLQMI